MPEPKPGLLPSRPDESGAVALLIGMLTLVLMMFAAFAVDLGLQINKKELLNDALDSAAQAGASMLPGNSVQAGIKAAAFAQLHDATETGADKPNVDFWCVVASKASSGATYVVDPSQIPATCYPGTSPWTVGANYKSTNRPISCSPLICAIPCVEPTPNTGTPKFACNTIRVYQGRDVPFQFSQAGGISKGSTGDLVSVACKGSCGTIAPNPMDVAVVADRTGSMSSTDRTAMVNGIQSMLTVMTADQQYVSLGTIGRGSVATTPTSEPGTACPSTPSASTTAGAWMSVPFSNNYLDSTGTATNANSALVKSLTCLAASGTGTALAAPMKAAARYLLGLASNNLSSLPTRQDPATKVLIFETDGQPNESPATGGTASLSDPTDLFSNVGNYATSGPVTTGPVTSGPVSTTQSRTTGTGATAQTWTDTYKTTYRTTTNTTSNTRNGGQQACANLSTVATNAKAQNILVITVGYNLANTYCGSSNTARSNTSTNADSAPTITSVTPVAAQKTVNGNKTLDTTYTGNATVNQTVDRTTTVVNWSDAPDPTVLSTLAGAASPVNGVQSAADSNCATTAEQAAENADGDYFFCAASGSDMASIFRTALSQTSKGIKLLRLP